VAFNSLQFAVFCYVVLVLVWTVPLRMRMAVLLVASWVFYATWSLTALPLLIGEGVVVWAAARGIERDRDRSKAYVAATVVVLIGILAAFKIATTAGGTGGIGGLIDVAGAEGIEGFALPVGISFFTFQAVGYVIDVHRREVEARPLPTVLTFTSFFPYLLAGPISRGKRIFPQLERPSRRIDRVAWAEGAELILIGLFQKVVLADSVRPATTAVLGRFLTDQERVSSIDLWLAVAGTLLWVVLDFAGYSNIARGVAKLLGVELPYNFRQPLTASRSFQDFWRRHHMTLMAWFRDYVYTPLHRRRDLVRNDIATVVVFVLSGIWHGFTLGWVAWGISVGLLVVGERRLRKRWRAVTGDRGARRSARILQLAMFTAISVLAVGWVLVTSLGVGLDLAPRLLLFSDAGGLDQDQALVVLLAVAAMVAVDRRQVAMEHREGAPDPVTLGRALAFGGMVAALLVYSGAPPRPFLYFAF
jgi:alginate O-acetyltransferase complex protein AlgI